MGHHSHRWYFVTVFIRYREAEHRDSWHTHTRAGTCVQCNANKCWLSFPKSQSCANSHCLMWHASPVTWLALSTVISGICTMLHCTLKQTSSSTAAVCELCDRCWVVIPLQSPHSLIAPFEAISFLQLWKPLRRWHKKKIFPDALSWLHCWFV